MTEAATTEPSWDIGTPEPEGVGAVNDYTYPDDLEDQDSPSWGRTYDGDWKGYKNGSKVYLLAKDPRCLWGWGPPNHDCIHRHGHMCCREVGHPGRCADDMYGDPCERVQRPKDWDVKGRAEANR